MRTIIPYAYLKEDSWAEDFTPSQELRQKNMYVQCMGHYRSLPGYGVFDRSKLKSYLLLYTSHGTGIVRYMGKEIPLPPGYATLIDCSVPHSYFCAPEEYWDFRWIHFGGTCIEGYLSDYMDNWDIAPNEQGTAFFQGIYEQMQSNEQTSYITCSTRLIGLCSDMLVHVLKNSDATSARISPMVNSAIDLFEEEFQSDLDLTYICDKLSVSKYYFLRTFKQQTGFTPNDYLITVRLNHAKALLRSTTMTIEEIALECGFSASTYFIQVFKKREAVTPLHYRKFFLESTAE
ncbi:MAG: helix-turn-helix domain-containing protein [Lachnospiraceae bacterium]|nr:helix-turn-helix domain-containing protein [Lachnospiraceae bacterium]